MDRQAVMDYAMETYESSPEYLWKKYPRYAVLRHRDNGKWYAIIMNVPKNKLGLDGAEEIDVMDLKSDPEAIGSLRMLKGILPGYHMNKGSWISVILDGSVDDGMLCSLLDRSFVLTGSKG